MSLVPKELCAASWRHSGNERLRNPGGLPGHILAELSASDPNAELGPAVRIVARHSPAPRTSQNVSALSFVQSAVHRSPLG